MKESYIIANRTDVGKVREVNEDSMVTFDSPNGRVIAVCDGMGGQAAGDVASKLACDIITDILTNNTFGSPTEAITRACMAANQGIVHAAVQNPALEGMGATCVIVIIKDGLVYYGWVGDSRIYYISHGVIRQLSRDQSYVQQLVDQGQLTQEEAENHPQKNQILNALGLQTMTPPELCPAPLTPEPGSIILLCSDGLSGMVDNQTIASVVSQDGLTLQQKADQLVDMANSNGGLDNITVQLVQFGLPVVAKAKKKNNFLLYCIIVLILALAAFLFFFFAENKTKNEEPKEKVAPVEKVVTTPEPVKEERVSDKNKTTAPSPKKNVSEPKKTDKTEKFGKTTKTTKTKDKTALPNEVLNNKEKESTPDGFDSEGDIDLTGK